MTTKRLPLLYEGVQPEKAKVCTSPAPQEYGGWEYLKKGYLQLEHNLYGKSRLQSAVINSLIGSFKNHYQLRILEFLTDSFRQNSQRGRVGDLHLQLCLLIVAFSFAVGH